MRAAGRSRRARHSRERNSVHIFACFYCGWQAPCASVLTARHTKCYVMCVLFGSSRVENGEEGEPGGGRAGPGAGGPGRVAPAPGARGRGGRGTRRDARGRRGRGDGRPGRGGAGGRAHTKHVSLWDARPRRLFSRALPTISTYRSSYVHVHGTTHRDGCDAYPATHPLQTACACAHHSLHHGPTRIYAKIRKRHWEHAAGPCVSAGQPRAAAAHPTPMPSAATQ